MASESSSSMFQRISIIVIAIVVGGGTIGFYFLSILTNNDQAKAQQQQAELQKQVQDQQAKQASNPKESPKPLDGYTATAFEPSTITALKTEDIVQGTGATVAKGATIKANYFGWTSDGTIFDSSNKNGTPTPIEFPLSGVIKGWTDGIPGMKAGGVRKLSIPADQAYGPNAPAGSGISANAPLVFIVQLVSIK